MNFALVLQNELSKKMHLRTEEREERYAEIISGNSCCRTV